MIFLDNHSIPTSSAGLIIAYYCGLDLRLYVAHRAYGNMYHYSTCICMYIHMYISTSDFICKLLFSFNFGSSHSFT